MASVLLWTTTIPALAHSARCITSRGTTERVKKLPSELARSHREILSPYQMTDNPAEDSNKPQYLRGSSAYIFESYRRREAIWKTSSQQWRTAVLWMMTWCQTPRWLWPWLPWTRSKTTRTARWQLSPTIQRLERSAHGNRGGGER